MWRCEAGLCDALTLVIVSSKCKAVAPSCGQVFSWEFYSGTVAGSILQLTRLFLSFLCIRGLSVAGLRRSFRLSRKDRQESSGEDSELGESDFLTYEEVTRYQQRSNERPRLVALKRLRTAEFKPYVIFVKPRIPESRRRRSAATSPGGGEHGRLTDEDLQEMRQSAVQIDQQYGHLVDCVLIKEDSAGACAELRGILERLERDSFWVPLIWVRT
ncbi:hypothetical protein XENOCAPTIV_002836 [Xenoophorus captivus]|uniref:Guanylate kinase-like domain-containing protein n=1 Tax=Xenoophorus captivus TaxID=1517983 RepID=A0ABV0R6G9_9TELE